MRWHVVFPEDLAVFGANLDRGLLLLVWGIDDDQPHETRYLVHFFVDRHAFNDVLEAHRPSLLGQNRERIRIPFHEGLSRLHPLPIMHPKVGTVHDRVALAVPPLGVFNDERARSVHDDHGAVLLSPRPECRGT